MKFPDPPPADYEGDPISTPKLIMFGVVCLLALATPILIAIGFGLWG